MWSDYEIIPPFEQLGRPVFTLEPGEEKGSEITLERLAWQRGGVGDGGGYWEHSKPFYGAGVTAVVEYEPGGPAGGLEYWEDQTITGCFFMADLAVLSSKV